MLHSTHHPPACGDLGARPRQGSRISRGRTDERIVGGQEVDYPGKYPWIVFMTVNINHAKLLCGGSLITDRHVLSAGHCFAIK